MRPDKIAMVMRYGARRDIATARSDLGGIRHARCADQLFDGGARFHRVGDRPTGPDNVHAGLA